MKENGEIANAKVKFSEAYVKYFRAVYKFVYRKVKNEEIAEDITQDVFCAAWDEREVFLTHEEPKGWLMLTARNKLREFYRRMKFRMTEPLENVPEPEIDEADYGEIELEMTALDIIDEDEWQLLKDHCLGGMKLKELAEKYGITENYIGVQLYRIRNKLRNGIKR